MNSRALFCCFTLLTQVCLADDDTPVPSEVRALVESAVTALKSGDDAALISCWHSPEELAKLKQAQVTSAKESPEKPVDAAKEGEKELKRRTKDNIVTLTRAAQLRSMLTKLLADIGQLSLAEIDLDEDEASSPDLPIYDNADLSLRAQDGSEIRIGVDEIVKINGVWKFKGRLEDDFMVQLPEVN